MVCTNAADVRTGRDEHLVYAAQQGSSDAFDELQRIYRRRLYKTVIRITGVHEDAEDALQDTFLRAYSSIRKFEGRSSIYSWLTRIAVNSALAILRKRRAHPEILFDPGANADDNGPHVEVMDSSPNPEQIVGYRQRRIQLMRAIQGLNPKLRIPIQLLITQECSLKEICAALGIPQTTAKARLYRARHRLTKEVRGTPPAIPQSQQDFSTTFVRSVRTCGERKLAGSDQKHSRWSAS
jgi:RNA polymerase sigma-70 factor (ECF subfamily)